MEVIWTAQDHHGAFSYISGTDVDYESAKAAAAARILEDYARINIRVHRDG